VQARLRGMGFVANFSSLVRTRATAAFSPTSFSFPWRITIGQQAAAQNDGRPP
jgi:hypothetical protein